MLQRITRRDTFRRFAPPAPRVRSGTLTVVVAPRDPDDGPGAGVATAISRRVGTAVVRNRLRRQVRAALRSLDASAPLADGWYLVIVHPAARGRSTAELADALADVLGRAGARAPHTVADSTSMTTPPAIEHRP